MPETVRVAVVGDVRAQAAGLGVFGFSVKETGVGGNGQAAVRVAMDYSQFRYAYGGDWAQRLQLMAFPECVLSTPELAECSTGVVVETVNDVASGVISADIEIDDRELPDRGVDATPGSVTVPSTPGSSGGGNREVTSTTSTTTSSTTSSTVPGAASESAATTTSTTSPAPVTSTSVQRGLRAGGGVAGRRVQVGGAGGTVYGWSAGYTSPLGNFAATSLTSASSWSVGLGMGSFDWSYPVPMPPSGFGAAPSVGFTYSSSAVDGVVMDENNQGLLGAGWSLASGGFIERTYQPCKLVTESGESGSNDLCWMSDNATISLNGRSSELVKVETTGSLTKWRLKDDPGWFIEREQGVAVSASDNRGERWTVWSPDGTKYVCGLRAQSTGGELTESVWTVPVYGNHTGEPCFSSWCQQAWRWNLDRVQDPSGNIITYMYEAEDNSYARGGVGTAVSTYQRGGYLREMDCPGDPDGSVMQPRGLEMIRILPRGEIPKCLMYPLSIIENFDIICNRSRAFFRVENTIRCTHSFFSEAKNDSAERC